MLVRQKMCLLILTKNYLLHVIINYRCRRKENDGSFPHHPYKQGNSDKQKNSILKLQIPKHKSPFTNVRNCGSYEFYVDIAFVALCRRG